MRIGIPRESRPGETLVAATAKTAEQLAKLGYEVIVESGAGAAADQADEAFTSTGTSVGSADDVWSSDIVVKVNAPTDEEIARLKRGATIISLMAPMRSPELIAKLEAAGVTALPWTPCPASAARSRWTCSPRWPTSRVTAPSSSRRTSSAACSPAR